MTVYDNWKEKQQAYDSVLDECSQILGPRELGEDFQTRLLLAWEQLRQAEYDVELTELYSSFDIDNDLEYQTEDDLEYEMC